MKVQDLIVKKEARIRELEAALADKDAALGAALEAARNEIGEGRAILKKAMLSGDIPTTPNTYTLVNADLHLRDAQDIIAKAKEEKA